MQEIITIELSGQAIESLSEHGALLHELRTRESVIHTMLVSYHYASRGYVSDVSIDPDSIEYKSETNGFFRVHYNLNYTISCSDVKYNTSDKMVFRFVLDFDKATLMLYGENIPEREPDEF